MNELKKQLKDLIIEELHLDGMSPDEIEDEAPLFGEGLGLDSLDALQLAVGVEEKFGVRIENEDAGKIAFRSLQTLAKYVADHRAA